MLQARRYGRVVIASSTAVYGMALSVPYCTAKASYLGFVRALAAEGASYGITVNAVEPSGATRMSENLAESDFRTWFLETMRPELVTPVVAALAHEGCTVSGEAFVVGGGRVARTVLAESRGYVNPTLTAEDVRDHLGEVIADTEFSFPNDTSESLRMTAAALGHDLALLDSLSAQGASNGR